MIEIKYATPLVIAIDPGKSAGIAVFQNTYLIHCAQDKSDSILDDMRRFHEMFRWENHTMHISCERFIIGHRTYRHSVQNDATEMIGAVTQFAYAHKTTALHMQTAAEIKNFVSDSLLQKIGFYPYPGIREWSTGRIIGRDAHDARDAIRHGLYTLACYHATVFDEIIRAGIEIIR